MSKIKLIILFLYLVMLSCKNRNLNNLSFKNLDEAKVYLIFRGTNTKHGFLAREFNIKDTISSHVGFLLYEKEWLIYNVSDFQKSGSALHAQTIEEFKTCDDGKVTNISIWKIKSKHHYKYNILPEIKKLVVEKVTFDKFFDLENRNLYCSEFVVEILKSTDSSIIILPVERELKGIYKSYFRKDTLKYYPVDIFHHNDNFEKIYDLSF